MNKLFTDRERDFDGPANYNENTYDFFCRSSRKDVTIVRNKLNDWFSKFPDEEKAEMKNRFRKDFDSSFYELFLFHFFSKLNFDIKIHPTVPNSEKKPDFLISRGDLEIYVEAKVVKGKSESEEAFERKRNEFYDCLNKLQFDRFLISLDELNFLTENQPSSKGIIKHLKNQIEKLDPDELEKLINSGKISSLPKIDYKDKNIQVIISVFPLIKEASSEKHKRVIGMLPAESFMGTGEELLKKAISKKAKRYGELNKPFIVCINSLDYKTSDKLDIENCIWGSLAWSWSTDPENRDEKWIRKRNGSFVNNKGPRIKNVSAIMINKASPFNTKNSKLWLFKHPYSKNELDLELLGLSFDYIKDGEILNKKGRKLSDFID